MSPSLEILCALALAAVAAAYGARVWLSRLPVIRQRVIVPLRDPSDHSVRGVVLRTRGPWIVMADVVLVRPGGAEVRMPGEVVVHQANAVLFQADPS